MVPGPRNPRTSALSPRLRMRAGTAPPGAVEGAWWPRSTELAEQLPAVLIALWEVLGGVERVVYNSACWADDGRCRIAVRGRLVQLSALRTHHPDTIDLVSATTRRATTLLVVPVATDPESADRALTTATRSGRTRIVSRFVGQGATAAGLCADEAGGTYLARAEEEERHAATERTQAARTVAGHAMDASDCRRLLSMLGLDAADGVRASQDFGQAFTPWHPTPQ